MDGSVGTPVPRHRTALDDRTRALVCLGALIATTASPTAYRRLVDDAIAAGATPNDVVATLIAVSPTVGLARLVSATDALAFSLGYDINAALESLEEPPSDEYGSRPTPTPSP